MGENTQTKKCSKCERFMESGKYMLSQSATPICWNKGVSAFNQEVVDVFACQKCGYLESYLSKEKFGFFSKMSK